MTITDWFGCQWVPAPLWLPIEELAPGEPDDIILVWVGIPCSVPRSRLGEFEVTHFMPWEAPDVT